MPEVAERVTLEDGHKLGDKAVIAVGARIYGYVSGIVGANTTVYRGASVRGTVGKNCTISVNANVDERAEVGDKVWVGETATVKGGAKVGSNTVVPAHATVTSDMEIVRRGDLLVVGMVGSESNGRYVTVGRQPDNRARLIVGCWQNHKGGSVDELETRLGTNLPWTNYCGSHNPNEALFYAQYGGIVQMVRSLERYWATYTEAAA